MKLEFTKHNIYNTISVEESIMWNKILKDYLQIGIEIELSSKDAGKKIKNNCTVNNICDKQCKRFPCELICESQSIGNECSIENPYSCVRFYERECDIILTEQDNSIAINKRCQTCSRRIPIQCHECRFPKSVARKYVQKYCSNCNNFESRCFDCDSGGNILRNMFADNGIVQSYSPIRVNKSGVNVIKHDHSIAPYGTEITSSGLPCNDVTIMNYIYEINKAAINCGFKSDPSCGIHFHFLLPYQPMRDPYAQRENIIEPFPSIIMMNIINLFRIWSPNLIWLSMNGNDINALTRYSIFRQSIFHFAPSKNTIDNIISKAIHSYGKYGFLNINNSTFIKNENGNNILKTFHIECRFIDSMMIPTAIYAYSVICYAIILKAIKDSIYGVRSTDKKGVTRIAELFNKLCNRGLEDRESNTSNLTREDMNEIHDNTEEMLNELKNEICFISEPAYKILCDLNNEPIPFRKISGETEETIEKKLWNENIKNTFLDNTYSEEIIKRLYNNETTIERILKQNDGKKILEKIGIAS